MSLFVLHCREESRVEGSIEPVTRKTQRDQSNTKLSGQRRGGEKERAGFSPLLGGGEVQERVQKLGLLVGSNQSEVVP